MKITDVRCVQLVRRLERVQRNSCGAREERRFNLVLVETDAGLTGLVYGRNIFQTASPGDAVDAVREVFHRGASIDQVLTEHPALGTGSHDTSADSRY